MNNELTPIDIALRDILNGLEKIAGTEQCDIVQSVNRIVAKDMCAPIDVPGTDNSAMDGYAVYATDTETVPVILPVSQRIAAGSTGKPLDSGTVARIFTGAPLPQSANAVVMQENCEPVGDASAVRILQSVSTGENVRQKG